MVRNLGLVLAAALLLLPCTAGGQSVVIPQSSLQQHGLTRAWFTQVAVDRANGRILSVTQHGGMLCVQTDQAKIHALDAETGRTLWAVQVGRRGYPTQAPAANSRYIALVNGSTLFVLDRETGKQKWMRQMRGSPGAGPALSE